MSSTFPSLHKMRVLQIIERGGIQVFQVILVIWACGKVTGVRAVEFCGSSSTNRSSKVENAKHNLFRVSPLSGVPVDMSRCKFIVATSITSTESIYKAELPNGTVVNIYGTSNVAYAFLLDLKELLNFTFEVIPSTGFIQEGPNNTIIGSGQQIESGEGDIGIDLSKPVPYRVRHLRFLHAIRKDRVLIVFRQPRVQIYRGILFRPFRPSLWLCVFISWLVLLFCTAFVSSKHWKLPDMLSRIQDEQSIVLPVTATVLARGINMNGFFRRQDRDTLRITQYVIFVSSIFGLLMYSTYSAFIVSSLRRPEPPIKTFKDLMNYNYELQAQQSLPDFTNVYVRDRRVGGYYAQTARKNFVSVRNSISRLFREVPVEGGGVAWFTLEADFYYSALQSGYTTRDICRIASLQPEIQEEHPRLLSMFIRKDNTKSLREAFNRKILGIRERGLGARHNKVFDRQFHPRCDPARSSLSIPVQRLRIQNVYAAFLVLVGGVAFAFLILSCEFLPILLEYREDCIARRLPSIDYE